MVDLLALPHYRGIVVLLKALRRMFFEKSGIEDGVKGMNGMKAVVEANPSSGLRPTHLSR
jgi:hypothetical protein